ncbi:MAG: type II 3-dehydroquinate dehydratase [Eubacteriales bacterium]
MKILIINGPNLNMLGIREPEIYGSMTLEQMNEKLAVEGNLLELELDFFQSNHEGAIIDRIQEAYGLMDGIIINPGAYSHYSYAIRDAIKSVDIKTVEVHLSDIANREYFRKTSVIEDVVEKQISGKGINSYFEALQYLKEHLK